MASWPPTLTLWAEVGHVSVIIKDFTITVSDQATTTAAKITWEDRDYPNQVLFFEVQQDDNEAEAVDEACADAFLAACFPLAAIHSTRARFCSTVMNVSANTASR